MIRKASRPHASRAIITETFVLHRVGTDRTIVEQHQDGCGTPAWGACLRTASHRIGAMLWALACGAQAISAQAATGGACSGDQTTARPVSIVASGGVSKGAYQAGALWGMLQYERAIRARSPEASVQLPGLAGASAGNLNVLLSAIEWATPLTPGRDETLSPLWQTWTGVGTSQLLPERASDARQLSMLQAGAFDPAIDAVDSLSKQPHLSCRLLLGITMTRADDATRYAIRDIRDAQVLRHATITEFIAGPEGFQLRSVSASRVRPSSGVTVTPASDSSGRIPLRAYLEHVKASAAFPLAFPPRQLEFVRLDATPTAGGAAAQRGIFVDGAIFDNEPLSLAVDLLTTGKAGDGACGGAAMPAMSRSDGCRVAFVSPDRRRGALAAVRRSPATADRASVAQADPAVRYRLLDFAGLLVKVIGSAADYELFALERRLQERGAACAPGEPASLCFLVSSRLFPIFGEKAVSFGAFLGRPMRELDFYLGAYDGLLRGVTARECEGRGLNAASLETCSQTALQRLLDAPTALPELSATGRTLLRAFSEAERSERGERTTQPHTDGRAPRAQELLALFDALREGSAASDSLTIARRQGDTAAVARWRTLLCPKGAFLFDGICDDGLLRTLHVFRSPLSRASRDSLARSGTPEERVYFGDRDFTTLISEPESTLLRLARRAVDRLLLLEEGDGWELGRMGLRAFDFALGKALQETQTGHHAASSAAFSMQHRRGERVTAFRIASTPLTATAGSRGTVTLDWLPAGSWFGLRRWTGGSMASVAPVASLIASDGRVFGTAGVRLESAAVRSGPLQGVSLLGQAEWCVTRRCQTGGQHLSVMMLQRTIGVGVRRLPSFGNGRRDAFEATLMVNDVPALLGVLFGR